jgi:hypothetical protein
MLIFEVYKALPASQMTTVLANIVAQSFGFNGLDDKDTEIVKSHLEQAIPTLLVIAPQLIATYKSSIRQCFEQGVKTHTDAAKVLRRILKKHNKALIWRRTTCKADCGKTMSQYKYRMI